MPTRLLSPDHLGRNSPRRDVFVPRQFSRADDADPALLAYLVGFAAVVAVLALGFYLLMRPTVGHNLGLAAYVPPPGLAMPVLKPYGPSRPITVEAGKSDSEAYAQAAANEANHKRADAKPTRAAQAPARKR